MQDVVRYVKGGVSVLKDRINWNHGYHLLFLTAIILRSHYKMAVAGASVKRELFVSFS